MAGRIKGCFDTVGKLRRHHPVVLCRFLEHFPSFLKKFNLHLPVTVDPDRSEEIPYDAISDALMSPDIPSDLAVLLILIGKLGNEQGWQEIESEAAMRSIKLDFNAQDMSYSDKAMAAWIMAQPGHPDLLEESFARARIHGKCSYTYYPMVQDVRAKYRKPDAEAIKALEAQLDVYFGEQEKLGTGAKVLIYDYDAEIWFLVRHPGLVRREGIYEKGRVKNMVLTPEQYDAVVYHKKYGDLRLNTHRKKEHVRYRIDFGHLLFGSANIFDPTKKIIQLEPVKGDYDALCRTKDVPGLQSIHVSEVCFYAMSCGQRRVTWHAENENESLPYESENQILPEDTDTVLYAKLRYQLREDRGTWHTMTVHSGRNLTYERDGDSCVLEEWLRERRFIDARFS